jgi:hypothetical protein
MFIVYLRVVIPTTYKTTAGFIGLGHTLMKNKEEIRKTSRGKCDFDDAIAGRMR